MKKDLSDQIVIAIMKASLIPMLLLLFVFCSYAKDSSGQKILDRKITLKYTGEIRAVFTALEKLTEVKFVYSPELIGASRQVSIDVQDKELQKVLSELLTPLELRFEMVNNYVILSRRKRAAGAENLNFGEIPDNSPYAFVKVGGRITATNGQPLEGVSVVVKGTHIGTTTNSGGEFSLNMPDPKSVLVISYIGYQDQEVAVDFQVATGVSLGADGSFSGGRYSYAAPWLTLNYSGGRVDKLFVQPGRDWENKKNTIIFSGLTNSGIAVWGKKK